MTRQIISKRQTTFKSYLNCQLVKFHGKPIRYPVGQPRLFSVDFNTKIKTIYKKSRPFKYHTNFPKLKTQNI